MRLKKDRYQQNVSNHERQMLAKVFIEPFNFFGLVARRDVGS